MGIRRVLPQPVFQVLDPGSLPNDDRLKLRDPLLEPGNDLVSFRHLSLHSTRMARKRLE